MNRQALIHIGDDVQPLSSPEDGTMNDGTRLARRPWRAWAPAARTAAATIAIALALLAAACSSSPSSTVLGRSPSAAESANSPSAVAYSDCMRSHGVPNFPDPSSSGVVPKISTQELGISSTQLQSAQTACQHLYPTNGGALGASLRQCEETGNCPQAMVQQVLSAMRSFSQCMRSHGVPNWPDPTVDSEGRPGFNLVPIHGTDWNAPLIQNKIFECERVMPPGGGVPAIYPGGPG